MEKKYISVDVETTGPTPGNYSMVSLGACVVGQTSVQFYEEIKPLEGASFLTEALEIIKPGIKCKSDRTKELYEENKNRDGQKSFINDLKEKGTGPMTAMNTFKKWIETIVEEGYKPIMAAAPIVFDGMFINWYFNKTGTPNPFGHSGEDMNSLYRGMTRNIYVSLDDIEVNYKPNPKHNTLEDAIYQAKQFEEVLDMIKA